MYNHRMMVAAASPKSLISRQNLLEAAIDLIWQSNYDRVGINDICTVAGVTKGCFYHHFDSKASLFQSAALFYWEQTKEHLDRIFSPHHTAIEQLHGLLGFIVEKHRTELEERGVISGCPFFTCGAQAGAEEEKLQDISIDMSEKVIRYSTILVRNLQEEACLSSPAEPAWVGRLLHAYIHGLVMYARIHQDLATLEKDLYEGGYRLLNVKPDLRRICHSG